MTWPSWACLAAVPFWLAAIRDPGGWMMWAGDILYLLSGVGYALEHEWAAAGTVLAWTALNRWRRGGKGRRKAAALFGMKSRALRDALVRRVRESGKARPALRPVPVPG